MKNAMFVGLAIGMVAGACLASNSKKTRQAMTTAQEQIRNKLCPQQEDGMGGENGGMQQSEQQ